jgi:Flp pilus assembly pilin Flp
VLRAFPSAFSTDGRDRGSAPSLVRRNGELEVRRSRCRVNGVRGASAPEYAIGAGLLAVLLVGGMQALEGAAADRYDDQQAVVGTPVTDLGGTTATTTASTGTTATIPSTTTTTIVATTTTTAGPATTTTTAAVTTTTLPTLSLSATGVRGSGTNWSISFTVTSSSPTGSVTVRSMNADESGTCTLSGGTCSGSIGGLKNQDGAQTATATAPGFATSNIVPVPVPS